MATKLKEFLGSKRYDSIWDLGARSATIRITGLNHLEGKIYILYEFEWKCIWTITAGISNATYDEFLKVEQELIEIATMLIDGS
jgi:hypothetical protein